MMDIKITCYNKNFTENKEILKDFIDNFDLQEFDYNGQSKEYLKYYDSELETSLLEYSKIQNNVCFLVVIQDLQGVGSYLYVNGVTIFDDYKVFSKKVMKAFFVKFANK
jgi:hypothetical protein